MRKRVFISLLAIALWVPVTSLAGPFIGDTDNDGVDDVIDNCTLVKNANQVDRDGDGCGNHCDGDYDQSGGTVGGDFATFKACVGKTVPAAGGPVPDPDCGESDMDGSGTVVGGDFALWKAEFGTSAGPSGSPVRVGSPICIP